MYYDTDKNWYQLLGEDYYYSVFGKWINLRLKLSNNNQTYVTHSLINVNASANIISSPG